MTLPRIAFCPASADGCATYRMWLPYLRTPNSKYIMAGDEGKVRYSDFSDCEIAMVQRLVSEENFKTLDAMKKLNMKIVFDTDDDMWSVQASNPAKGYLRMIENYKQGFIRCAHLADVITVSTNSLKTAIETHVGTRVPVKVVGNAMDLIVLQPSFFPKQDDRVVIGWAGSNTHIADLKEMGDSLQQVYNNNPKVWLHWVGMYPIGINSKARVMAHSWVPVKEYFSRFSTWNWDIGVAPLENNRFNRSKSAIKLVEFGAIKKPCLASDVQPYREITSLVKGLDWLLCRSPKEWTEKLLALSNDEAMRKYYGELLYEAVKEGYNMEKRIKTWHETFGMLAN